MSVNDFIEYEYNAQKDIYKKYLKTLGVKKQFTLPTLDQVITSASFKPYTETANFESYLDSFSSQLFNIWDNSVRSGYLAGIPTKNIVKDVLGSVAENAQVANAGLMNQLKNSVLANTRTALQSFANETRVRMLDSNKDLFTGYKYLATLDRRTCIVCGQYDGKVFTNIEDVPKVPQHFNCRCCIVPIVKDFEDFTDERASENGTVDGKVTYEDWFKEQSPAVQKDILGSTRYDIFLQTNKIENFINDGKIIKLSDLLDRGMANGQRRSIFITLTEEEKKEVIAFAEEINIPRNKIVFTDKGRTGYNEKADLIFINGDVYPSNDGSTHNRDTMSVKAVLAHEYYGHRKFRNTKLPINDYRDEFRASYYASVHAPNLSDVERQSLMRDALDRATEGGLKISINKQMRKILYGYD